MASTSRVFIIDLFRAMAIVLMVIFHFIYDLNYLGLIQTNIPNGAYWAQFRWLIISLFFVCVGASLRLNYEAGFNYSAWLINLVKIVAGAVAISIGSYYLLPQHWIFFGVLHFIAFSYVAALAFLRYPRIALLVGTGTVILGASQLLPSRWPFNLFFEEMPKYTNDYIQIIPWFGIVLIGIYFGRSEVVKNNKLEGITPNRLVKGIKLLSNNSLMIYLLHQPIIFGALFLVSRRL